MKFWKKAAIGILLLLFVCVSWYAVANLGFQDVFRRGTAAESWQESMEKGPMLENLLGVVSAIYKDGGKRVDTEKEREVSANVQEVLGIADIQKMKAGSVLDMRKIEEGLAESLFYSEELSPNLQQRVMGVSYQENDNVSMEELRYLRVLHVGFDGQTHIGELLVNQSIAADVLEIMAELYENEYAIERMVLVDEYGADDERSMEDNNTSAFNYRAIAGSSKLSRHSLGLAIDINPLYNPCVRSSGTQISPINAVDYADRNQEFAHKIDEDDLCYKLFTEHGFTWGGNWNSLKDYQHFEK